MLFMMTLGKSRLQNPYSKVKICCIWQLTDTGTLTNSEF